LRVVPDVSKDYNVFMSTLKITTPQSFKASRTTCPKTASIPRILSMKNQSQLIQGFHNRMVRMVNVSNIGLMLYSNIASGNNGFHHSNGFFFHKPGVATSWSLRIMTSQCPSNCRWCRCTPF